MNKNKVIYELGGFAEYPEDIDGDFEAYNRCLADEYLGAFYDENFVATGLISSGLLDTIREWSSEKEEVDKILNGTFITCKNRSIIDAIFEKRYGCLAELILYKGVFSPKLVVAILLSDEEIEPEAIICIKDENLTTITQKEFDERMKKLFDLIQEMYDKNKDDDFLLKIKDNYRRMTSSNKLKSASPANYGWCKRIKAIVEDGVK